MDVQPGGTPEPAARRLTTSSSRPRRFGLFDALLLGLATVPVFLVIRLEPPTLEHQLGLPPSPVRSINLRPRPEAWPGRVRSVLDRLLEAGAPVLVLISPGTALAVLCNRSTCRLRRVRGVGILTVAITGVMVTICLVNEYVLRRWSTTLQGFMNNPFDLIWREVANQVSVSVLAFWLVLALGGRWRAEPHWRDRLGRVIGLAWIAYWLLNLVWTILAM